MTSSRSWFASAAILALTACAGRPAPEPIAVVPAPAPAPAPPLPAGASPNMRVPAALPDGRYPTPNQGLSRAATLWHLRSALNVAALACRGPGEAATVQRYNALLAAHKAALAAAEKQLAAEYRAGGADWRDRYDDSMTRLYNFFSQAPARDAFCHAADGVLAETAMLSGAGLDAFAATRLPLLDRAFTDFYAAYDAWRRGSWTAVTAPALPPTVIAVAAPVPVAPKPPVQFAAVTRKASPPVASAVRADAPPIAAPVQAPPRLELDPSVFLEP